nr:protein phosphatase 1B-like isoform X1 [Paramormyrops kingsleyae]
MLNASPSFLPGAMGAFLDKPKTEKQNSHGEGNSLHYGLSSMQGWRVEMEDAHAAVLGLPSSLDAWSFFAVFDGHAGSRTATYCSQHLLGSIMDGTSFCGDDPAAVRSAIHAGFLRVDEDMRGCPDRSGSTAVALLASPRRLYFINCGDSRAVLCRGGRVQLATHDHKPADPVECERIVRAGGSVTVQRVNGSLAVSRALGDFDYKCANGRSPTEQQVSPEPEVYEVERSEDDEFALLACDGIWDVMSNEDACSFIRSRLQLQDNLEEVCNSLLDTCLHKGSRDNMSVVLVCFPNGPKVSEAAVRQEAELDRHLEARVEEIMQMEENGTPSMAEVMRVLASEAIPNLPPGGGLASKHGTIEAVYTRLNPHGEDVDSHGAEGGGTAATHLLDVLRQFRINHRGEYRQVLEGTLSSFCQPCDSPNPDEGDPEGTAPLPESVTGGDMRGCSGEAPAPPTA